MWVDEPGLFFPKSGARLWFHRLWKHGLRRKPHQCSRCLRLGMALERLSGFSLSMLISRPIGTISVLQEKYRREIKMTQMREQAKLLSDPILRGLAIGIADQEDTLVGLQRQIIVQGDLITELLVEVKELQDAGKLQGQVIVDLAKDITNLQTGMAGDVSRWKDMNVVVDGLRTDVHVLGQVFHNVDDLINEHIHAEKTIRRRIHATTSVKGVKKLEHTLEGTGYTLEEIALEWDAQDAAVEARQPSGSE